MGKQPFRVEAVLPGNARTYFLERDSAAFRSLLSRVLKLGVMEMTDVWTQGDSTFVRIVTRPDFGNWVPKGVQSQVGKGSLEFHDIIEYDSALIQRPPFKVKVKTESPFLGDKLDVRLELIIEEIDENTCRQVLRGHIKVNMFGVGRIVESIVKDSLQNTYKKLPEIVRRWQVFRAEALKNGNAKELISGRPPVGCSINWIRAEVLHLMQSPIEARGFLPPASPVEVLNPEDRSQFSTDEGTGEEAAAAAELAGLETQPSARCSEVLSMTMRSTTEYFDANDVLEDDSATSILRSASDLERAPSSQQRQRLQELPKQEVPEPAGTAPEAELIAALPPGSQHRRNLSAESADNSELAGGEPSPFQRQPTSHKSWRGFNNSYEAWEIYWDLMGVKHMAPREPPSGPFAYLYMAEDMLHSSFISVICSAYLFAMKKGLITVQPNEGGRYAGKTPRMDLDPRASQPSSPRPSDSASRPLLQRQRSAPSVPQQHDWEQGQKASGGGGGCWSSAMETVEAEARVGLQDGAAPNDAYPCAYGNTDQAAALVARVTTRSQPSAHRRSVSVDSGTTAAATAAAAAAALAGGKSASRSMLGGKAAGGGKGGIPKRRVTAQVPLPLDEDRVSPPKGFSCLPVCWHRRKNSKSSK